MALESTSSVELLPELSAVVVVKNREADLGVFLDEVTKTLEATCRDWELVVVDDASEDTSLEVLHSKAVDNPALRVLMQPEAVGKARALDRAIDASRRMVIVILEVGEPPTRDFLLEAWSALRSTDLVAGVKPNQTGGSFLRRLARSLRNRSLGVDLQGDGTGPMLLRRSAAEVIDVRGTDLIVGLEVVARANRAHLRWQEMPLSEAIGEPASSQVPPWSQTRAAWQLRSDLS